MQDSSAEFPKPDSLIRIRDVLKDAKKLSLEDLCREGDYKNNTSLRYPQTKGEEIVNTLLTYMLHEPYVEDNPVLDEMTSILSQLDSGVDKPEEWQALFALMLEIDS